MSVWLSRTVVKQASNWLHEWPQFLGTARQWMDGPTVIWQYGRMAKVKTTLSIDEGLMRQVRVRAARTGRRDSEVLEAALREGLGIIDRIRARAALSEEAAHEVASQVVHEQRVTGRSTTHRARSSRS